MDGFLRRHPLAYLLAILALAFAIGPLMISANDTTSVLYRDF
jgi:hypothetical protein